MKRLMIVLIVLTLFAQTAFSENDRKESILGKTLDETLSPFKGIFTPSQRLEPIVVTASRYMESSLDVSKNVTVIDESAIEQSGARNVPELIETQTGIVVRDWLGNGKTVNVDMRGFGERAESNTLVLIDGRRTNQIDMSGTDWAQISVNSVEKIEIVRGPQSVMYGDNAAGGVINIITKQGTGKKPEIGFKYQSGSYRYNSYLGFIEGGSGFLDYYGSASQSSTNGYRINNGLEKCDYNSSVTFKPTDSLKIRVEGGYHRDWYGMPGALFPSDIDIVGWRGTVFPNSKAKTQDAYLMFTPEVKKDVGFGEIVFSGDLTARGRRTASLSYFRDGSSSEQNTHIKTIGVTPKAAFIVDFLGISNRMIAGFDYYGNSESKLSDNFTGGKDLILITKDTVGLYIADAVELLSKVIINGGFRTEWAYYTFDQQAMIPGKNKEKPFEYAVEAGVDYKYNEKSAIYVNYARSFRFPLTDEWYMTQWKDDAGGVHGGLNLDLRPQTSTNYEIGIKENSSKYLGVKADYFLIDTRHELFFNPIIFSNALYDRTIRHGFELETHAYLINALECFANYTYEKAFFVGGMFAGNDITIVPRHKFSGGFKYTFMDCFNVNYTANFVGLRRSLNDQLNNMPRLKSYLINDIKLSYNKLGLEIYCNIYNIFNEKYSEYATLNSTRTIPAYYPSPGINYVIGIDYKF